MDNLLKLLFEIEKRPQLYIGNTDLTCLSHFLSGYCFAKAEDNNDCWKWLNGDFRAFLAEKYNDKRSYNWARLIIENEADGNSTDAFFRLLHEYTEGRTV